MMDAQTPPSQKVAQKSTLRGDLAVLVAVGFDRVHHIDRQLTFFFFVFCFFFTVAIASWLDRPDCIRLNDRGSETHHRLVDEQSTRVDLASVTRPHSFDEQLERGTNDDVFVFADVVRRT
jgi:hypothetical protein